MMNKCRSRTVIIFAIVFNAFTEYEVSILNVLSVLSDLIYKLKYKFKQKTYRKGQ